jgi:arsenite methyltransferase
VSTEPYSSPAMRAATGETIRPGGLELTRHALELAGLVAGERVLDVGCGTGATVQLMREGFHLDACGIDPSLTMVELGLATHPDLPLTVGNGMAPPCEDGTFAGVIMECALSITPEPRRVLSETNRILRPGGMLILTDMYYRGGAEAPSLPASAAACLCLQHARTRTALERDLGEAGFTLRVWEDHREHLKALALSIIMQFGSLARFVGEATADPEEPGQDRPPAAALTPASFRGLSYYLLVAEKTSC